MATITCKRNADFSNNGEYDIFADGQLIGHIYRDSESGFWYRVPAVGKQEHFSECFLEFRKQEAINAFVEYVDYIKGQ